MIFKTRLITHIVNLSMGQLVPSLKGGRRK